MSLVKRDINSWVPDFAEVVDVEVNDLAIEAVAHVVQRHVDHAADQRFLPELEEALEKHGQDDQADDDRQRLEGVDRHVACRCNAWPSQVVKLTAQVLQLGFEPGQDGRRRRSSRSRSWPSGFVLKAGAFTAGFGHGFFERLNLLVDILDRLVNPVCRF